MQSGRLEQVGWSKWLNHIFWAAIGEGMWVKDWFSFNFQSEGLIVCEAMPCDGLPQTLSGWFYHLFKNSSPPWSLFMVRSLLIQNILQLLNNSECSDGDWVDLKAFTLSEISLSGTPCHVVKLLKNIIAAMSGTKSRWIALVEQHVYKNSHTLEAQCPPDDITNIGPAKMTPVVWNGQDGVTWNYGRGSGSSQSGVSARADAAT